MKKIVYWTCSGQTEIEAATNEEAEETFRNMVEKMRCGMCPFAAAVVEVVDIVPN
jgi:hypothetical protein